MDYVKTIAKVVTHQWSGDLSIYTATTLRHCKEVVTHQWSGDLSIVAHLTKCFTRIKKNISPLG